MRARAAAWSGFIFSTSPLEKQYLFEHFGFPHPSVSWKKYRSINFRAATRFISSLPWSLLLSIFPSKFLPLPPLLLLLLTEIVVAFGVEEVDNVDDSSGILYEYVCVRTCVLLRDREIKLHFICVSLFYYYYWARIKFLLLRVFVCTIRVCTIFKHISLWKYILFDVNHSKTL